MGVITYSAEGLANVTLLQQESVVVADDTPHQVGRHSRVCKSKMFKKNPNQTRVFNFRLGLRKHPAN